MALPSYTKSGQRFRRKWLFRQLDEIHSEGAANPEIYPDWLPMMIELAEYCKGLEDRLILVEEEQS